jgi:hypothetical protein
MSDAQRRTVLRCPICFARENDVTLLWDQEGYYCIHCSYHGTASEVLEMYADLQKKYRWKLRRVTLDDLRTL